MTIDLSQFEDATPETPQEQFAPSAVPALRSRYAAGNLNPDLYAKSAQLAQKTGIPETVVSRNIPDAERKAAEPDWQMFESTAPKTAQRFVDDAHFFSLAHDDTENLKFWEKVTRTAAEMKDDVSKGYQSGLLQTEKANYGTDLMGQKVTPDALARIRDFDTRLQKLKGTGGVLENAAQIVGQMSTSIPDALNSGATLGSGAGLTALYAGQLGPQAALPEEVITAPAAAISAFTAGFGASMATSTYRQEAGSAYLDMLDSKVDPDIAAPVAMGVGLVNSAIEMAGFAVVSAPIKSAVMKMTSDALTHQLTTTTTGSAVKSFAKGYLTSLVAEPTEEVLQEVSSIVGEEVARSLNPTQLESQFATEDGRAQIRDRIEGIASQTLKGMLLLGLPGPAANFTVDMRRVSQSQKNVQMLQAIGERATDSKLLPRDPTAFENHLAQLAQGGPTENLYVNPKAFFNALAGMGKDPNKVIQEIPSVAKQWQEAQDLGADLVIPFQDYVSKIAPTEAHQALTPYLKFGQEQMTADEAKQFEAERQDRLKELEKAANEAATTNGWDEQIAAIQESITAQLDAVGKATHEMNAQQAKLASNLYAVMATRLQTTPEALWQEQSISVSGANVMATGFQQTKLPDTIDVNGEQFPTVDSTGKGIHHTADGVRNFWEWFNGSGIRPGGMVQSASGNKDNGKHAGVVGGTTPAARNSWSTDGSGIPRVYYHGTADSVAAFDLNHPNRKDHGWLGEGVYLTDAHELATAYAKQKAKGNRGENVMPLYAAVHNPYVATQAEKEHLRSLSKAKIKAWTEDLKAAGHDGVVLKLHGGAHEIVAFDPSQVKSAIGNTGAFDPQNPNVVKQGNRGLFNPESFNITLLQTADLSTFLHEMGHAYFEMLTNLADRVDSAGTATPLANDMDILLKWIGIAGDTPSERLATWRNMSLEDRRTGHEMFAESFEQYLFEGKAPTPELQPLFNRFKGWLKQVYTTLQKFMQDHNGAKLTDEVRGVMDRMFAVDDAIARAEKAQGPAVFENAQQAGMTDAEFEAYKADQELSREIATHETEQRVLRNVQWLRNAQSRVIKALQAKSRDVRKATREKIKAEMLKEKVYAADRFIRFGDSQPENLTNAQRKAMDAIAGASPKLSLPDLKRMYGDQPAAVWRYLPVGKHGLAATEGIHPDILATALGFKNGDQLVRALVSLTPFNEELENRTDQRMLEEHGELVDPDELQRAADRAVRNELRSRVIATELSAMQRLAKVSKYSVQVAREYARNLVARQTVKGLSASKYSSAEAKAARESQDAFKKGNLVLATAAKFRQVLNHFAVIEATRASDEIDSALRQFQKMFKARDKLAQGRNVDIVAAAQAILAEYGIGRANAKPAEYLAKVAEYDPQTAADLASIMGSLPNAGDYQKLTVEDFKAMRDVVMALWTQAKRTREIEIDGQKMEIETAVNELITGANIGTTDRRIGITRDATLRDRGSMLLLSAKAALRRVEHWVDAMDNGDIKGPFRKFLFTPIREAVDQYRMQKKDIVARYRDLVKTIEPGLTWGAIEATGLNYTFGAGKVSVLGAILHTGNESNLMKLLVGRGWGRILDDGSLDTSKWDAFIRDMEDQGIITEADWRFVQGVWDMLEELKPQAQKAHHAMYGYYFDEVQAKAVQTKYGTLRGGYFPAIADPESSARMEQYSDAEALTHGQNSFMLPTTGRGFTKSRTGVARPLLLDLRATSTHIDKLLRFVHIEPHVKDVYRLTRNATFAGAMERLDPKLINDMIMPWLQRTALQTVSTPSESSIGRVADRMFSKLRANTGLSTMAGNVVNTMQQVTGFSIAALKVPVGDLLRATAQYTKNPQAMAAFTDGKSPFMRTRTMTQAMEIQGEIDNILDPNKYRQAQQFAMKHGYVLQQLAQNYVDRIVWTGAYNDAVTRGLDETAAVRSADSAVRETQGSFNPEDISKFEAGTALSRLFTMFYSYFNMQANLLGTEFGKAWKESGLVSGRALYIYTLGLMIPAVVSELISAGSRGQIDDEDDDGYLDEYLALFFGAQARTLSAMVPVVGQGFNAVLNKTDGKWYNDHISLSPAVNSLDAMTNTAALPIKLFNGQPVNERQAVRDLVTTLSVVTGIPLTVVYKAANAVAGG